MSHLDQRGKENFSLSSTDAARIGGQNAPLPIRV
jgi:hypothetical protein